MFVHANQLPEEVRQGTSPLLSPGQRVSFVCREDPQGRRQAQVVQLCAEPDVLSERQFQEELAKLPDAGPSLLQLARDHGWVA